MARTAESISTPSRDDFAAMLEESYIERSPAEGAPMLRNLIFASKAQRHRNPQLPVCRCGHGFDGEKSDGIGCAVEFAGQVHDCVGRRHSRRQRRRSAIGTHEVGLRSEQRARAFGRSDPGDDGVPIAAKTRRQRAPKEAGRAGHEHAHGDDLTGERRIASVDSV